MLRFLPFLLLLLVFPIVASASSPADSHKHPFTFEDMMALKRVEEPEVSPDGKWVLFAAVDVDLKANMKTPHVWVVPIAGGQEKEIIADQDADRPRWAPDGKRFAFVSSKEHGSQVWIADFDGATRTVTGTHRLTNLSTEADGELWSPDGKNILFKSDVYPECEGNSFDELMCIERKFREAKNSKVKAQIFTHLLYRHWNAYKEGKRTHLFVIRLRWSQNGELTYPGAQPSIGSGHDLNDLLAIVPRDLTPGDYDAPVFSLGGQDDYAFSPDGKELCYASNHDSMPAASTNNDLFTVPVNFSPGATSKDVLAATKDITAENKAADNTPLYSPDGKYIAYRAQQRPGYESDRFGLTLYNRDTGQKTELTKGFDQWVGTFIWAINSKTIYFSSEHKRHSLIYAVNTAQANDEFARRTLIANYNDDLAITPDGQTLVFTRMSIQAPNEIYAANTAGDGCPSRTGDVDPGKENCSLNKDWALTHLNDKLLSQVNMSSGEPFWFTGAHNDKVEGFLVKPPNFDPNKKHPVKFLIHGGPEGNWGDDWSYRWNPELFAANGYVVVMINFHGSTGYGQKFIDAINGDWGGAPFEDLMKGLDYVDEHYGFIDKDRECALGASYGGYM